MKTTTTISQRFENYIYSRARACARAQENWLANELSALLEPDVFLRAYGNDQCRSDVARVLAEKGISIRKFESDPYTTELWQNGKLISTFKVNVTGENPL